MMDNETRRAVFVVGLFVASVVTGGMLAVAARWAQAPPPAAIETADVAIVPHIKLTLRCRNMSEGACERAMVRARRAIESEDEDQP